MPKCQPGRRCSARSPELPFGRDCFCAQGGHCWLTEAALDGLKYRVDVGQTEIVGDVEAAAPARLRQILEVSKQLQEWQRAAKVVAA